MGKGGKQQKKDIIKLKTDRVGKQRMEMLKVRPSLEKKLKQRSILNSVEKKSDQAQKPFVQRVNRKLESFDDFCDEAPDKDGFARGLSNGRASSLHSSKMLKLVTLKVNKPKVISGDDDLPRRDDIGERRRKHEPRVLAKASRRDGAELEDAKLAAKAQIYSITSSASSPVEIESVDGRRLITSQMEKNRGLTRSRNKLLKNPRNKYKMQHEKKMAKRRGQVRDVKRPSGPYGGESTGINPDISRSIRLKL